MKLLTCFLNSQQELIGLQPFKNIDERTFLAERFHRHNLLEIHFFEPSEVRQHPDKLVMIAPSQFVLRLSTVEVAQLFRFFVDQPCSCHRLDGLEVPVLRHDEALVISLVLVGVLFGALVLAVSDLVLVDLGLVRLQDV